MTSSRGAAFSVVSISAAVVVFSVLTRTRSRKKKPSSALGVADNKDIISQLPDDILISIIANMPVKCAVKTTLLSKRWRNLYRYLSNIKLNCRDLLGHHCDPYELHDSNLIIESVNRFLWLRSGSEIHSFHLSCCFYKINIDQFKHWIYSLGRLGVEKLFLHCGCYAGSSKFSFPFDLLSEIPTLKYFELSLCSLQPSLKSQLNSLQNLCLSSITVYPGSIECILSNCLILHSLRMGICKCPSKLSFRGSHLRLKSLYINDCEGLKEIEFYATNLGLFEFSNPQLVNFTFDHVPQLHSIYLNVFKENIVPYVGDLPLLKSLTFVCRGDHFIKESIRPMGSNMFSKLRRLNLTLYTVPQSNFLFLTPFLQSCSRLQEFHLNTTILEYNAPQEKKWPILIHSELVEMEINGFGGTKYEIEFALYILKSAIRLEKMHVSRCFKIYEGCDRWRRRYDNPWSEEERRKIHMKLQGQAISKTAQVIIQHKPDNEDYNWTCAKDDCNNFV